MYFDTRCPFSLRSSALICQRTTRAVILVFTAERCTADVYLDDSCHGAKHSSTAFSASERLQELLDKLGLQTSPEKDCPPSIRMICLGLLVDTYQMLICWNFIRSYSSGCNFPSSQGVNCSCHLAHSHLSQLASGRAEFLYLRSESVAVPPPPLRSETVGGFYGRGKSEWGGGGRRVRLQVTI